MFAQVKIEDRHMCEVCGATFDVRSSLRVHRHRKHRTFDDGVLSALDASLRVDRKYPRKTDGYEETLAMLRYIRTGIDEMTVKLRNTRKS